MTGFDHRIAWTSSRSSTWRRQRISTRHEPRSRSLLSVDSIAARISRPTSNSFSRLAVSPGNSPTESARVRLGGFQVPLGLERGHAAGPRRRDRLAVDVVLAVARRENALHGRLGRPGLRLDVALRQERELAPENLRVRLVTDRDEEAVHLTVRERPG